ncbi:hypothetical protein MBAV_001791 [Candidatus Magnetobacterium bavaricum]|uniref:DUF4145 domain-containing protein n=1 Tax=Candidatus Magnetobacterium bavaricum TaxID=29290 RepID=A0A0F3GZA1_9BACT|nr:hypothetical protein MBAV_001791 [Candidatus Magnetobacterium bavaricum]
MTAKIRGYNKEDLLEREPITLDSDAYVEYLKSVAETYPFLAIMGLRVLTETTLKRVCEERKIRFVDTSSLSELINGLAQSRVYEMEPTWVALQDFRQFLNIASHGYKISPDIAQWALEAIPAILNEIKAKTL